LTFADMARAQAQGLALQAAFGNINTDNPDLTRFRERNGKMIQYHGTSDPLIPIQGSNLYYFRVAKTMGGYSSIRQFYRYFQIPAMSHCHDIGSVDGTAGVSPKADPPLPAPSQLFTALVDWVEKGEAPNDIRISNSGGSNIRPLCAYPAKLKYIGGDRASAGSYVCK
jgi:hypothetical protein